MMKRLISLTICLMTALLSFAHDFEKDGIYYKYNVTPKTIEAEVTFKGTEYDSFADEYTGDVTIPSSVNFNGRTLPVTRIDTEAFRGCTGLTSVTIPNSVTVIGYYVFDGCTGLTSVTIPNSVTSIAGYSFSNCSKLTSITIPNSVTEIGEEAFQDCTSLNSITIPESVTAIGNRAFWGTAWYNNQPDGLVYAGNVAYKYKGTMPANTKITLKDGTSGIAGAAFRECSSLTSVTIPNSVTSIGRNAFKNCSGLTSITIPESVMSIGYEAFRGCTGLTSVSIPNSVTEIGYWAFGGCTGLTSITIPNSVTEIGPDAFEGCSGLTSITIPNSVTEIGDYAFSGCSGLTSITIPNGVTRISWGTFQDCTSLTSVTIPESVKDIGTEAFFNCSSLTSVTVGRETPVSIISNVFSNRANATLYVPKGSKSAYQSADYWKEFKEIVEVDNFLVDGIWYRIISSSDRTVEVTYQGVSYDSFADEYTGTVKIPSSITYGGKTYSVTKIGQWAFRGCKNLASVTIPNSVTTIGDYAFYGCSNITAVTIPKSVTTIGYYAFQGNGLYAVAIPNGVTSIGNGAFSGCKNLSSATIPSSVTTIGSYAFDGCSSLTSVYVGKETPVSINSSVFSNRANATLYVPYGCKSAYSSANYWKDFKSIVEMNYFVVDGICYHVLASSAQTVEVTNKESASGTTHKYTGSVTIPSSVTFGGKTYSVTTIGESALRTCSGLTSVSIPNTVTTIDSYAFRESKDLTSITIPEGVKYINTAAFRSCTGLTDVIIPSSVTSISDYAFDGCSSLTSVTVQKETPVSISSNVFSNRANATLYVPTGSKSAYEAANYWKEFKKIVEVDYFVVDGIWYRILSSSDLTVQVTYRGSKYNSYANEYTGAVNIPSSITYGGKTYRVTEIGSNAFDECSSLTSVTIPDGMTFIRAYAFYNCIGLTEVTIPNSVTNIGLCAFENCYKLTSVNIPDGVTGISIRAFMGCSSLTSITIPNGVTSISDDTFYGCSRLTSITIPDGVTSIGKRAFYKCSSLTSITIPNSVRSIGYEAFYKCSSLTSVTIPKSVTSIGYDAFRECSSLTSVTVWRETPVSIGEYVFSNRANATLYVPYGSKSAYEAADYWKEFREIIEMNGPYVVGDINGDNVVDILDYTGVGNYIHGNAPEGFNEEAADVDKNGIIDILDYTGIANIIHTGNIFGN